MISTTENLLKLIERYKTTTIAMKELLCAYFQNDEFPLEERWVIYTQVPRGVLEHDSWVVHFNAEKLLPNKEIEWYDEFNKDRYSIIKLKDIVEEMIREPNKYSMEFITAFQEEILKLGLGSFEYDW